MFLFIEPQRLRQSRRFWKSSSVTGLLDARLSPSRANGWAGRAWAIAEVQGDEVPSGYQEAAHEKSGTHTLHGRCVDNAATTYSAADETRRAKPEELLRSKYPNSSNGLVFVIQVKCDRDFTQDLHGYHWILTDKPRGKDIKKMRIVEMDGQTPQYASEISWDGPVELL